MIFHPFSLLHPYRDRLSVGFWNRADGDVTLEDAAWEMSALEVAHLNQVHGGEAVRMKGASDATEDADAMATDKDGLLLLSKSADCQTFAFYDPKNHVAAVAHAGWRGLLAHTIEHTIVLMEKHWKSSPKDILVVAAPSLGLCCSEFTDPLRELPEIDRSFFHGHYVDLQGIADKQLQDAGITKDHIERMTMCTKCNKDLLWSFRGEPQAIKNGSRNLLGIVLK